MLLQLYSLLGSLLTQATDACRRYKTSRYSLEEDGDGDLEGDEIRPESCSPIPEVSVQIQAVCSSDVCIHLPPVTPEECLEMCKNGDLIRLRSYTNYNLNDALLVAVQHNRMEIVEYLLEEGATNLDQALTLSCSNNLYNISELLIKKGARTICGLRVSKSPNITRMLYRYEQGSENIV